MGGARERTRATLAAAAPILFTSFLLSLVRPRRARPPGATLGMALLVHTIGLAGTPLIATAHAAASHACVDATETRAWKAGEPVPTLDGAQAAATVIQLDTPQASAAELVGYVGDFTRAGARCFLLPGQASAGDLRVAVDLPTLGEPDGLAMLPAPPMVLWGQGDRLVVGRWPLSGATVAGSDTALADALLRVERLNKPTARDAFLHVDPAWSPSAIGGMVERLLGRGIQAVTLHTGPSRWTPTLAHTPDPGGWKSVPVTNVRRVFVGADGELDLQFPLHVGRPTLTLTAEDVLAWQESCTQGTCDLVVVTPGERFFVNRRPDPGAIELTRRVLFGAPVVPYVGPGLAGRSAPQVSGAYLALPNVTFNPPSDHKEDEPGYLVIVGNIDRVRVAHVLSDRDLLIRECFIGEASSYWGGLSRNPFGGIAVGFSVNPDGHVRSVEMVKSSIRNDHLEACVLDAMGATRFPASADGNPVQITWRMGFGIAD